MEDLLIEQVLEMIPNFLPVERDRNVPPIVVYNTEIADRRGFPTPSSPDGEKCTVFLILIPVL